MMMNEINLRVRQPVQVLRIIIIVIIIIVIIIIVIIIRRRRRRRRRRRIRDDKYDKRVRWTAGPSPEKDKLKVIMKNKLLIIKDKLDRIVHVKLPVQVLRSIMI